MTYNSSMFKEDFEKLIENIKKIKAEDNFLELKAARGGTPNLYSTLSSFSNQNNGGKIVLGIDENVDFTICGISDPTAMRKNIERQCKEMMPEVIPEISIIEYENKTIMCIEIPGVKIFDRPVFYKGKGMLTGAYKRVGDRDERLTPYEVYSYEAYKKRVRDDERPVENVDEELINKEKLDDYLKKVKKDRINLQNAISDTKILEIMRLKKNNIWTIAGLLIFSNFPQANFMQFSITASVIPGSEKGIEKDEKRFIDDKRITGSIEDMLQGAMDFIEKNMKNIVAFDENGNRKNITEYPMLAIREAILNSIVHRDYSVHTEGIPISIEMYSDRLEIRNPGGIYGNEPVENLGLTHINTRNEALVNALEIMGITENRYSGIPRMRQLFDEAGLRRPVFKVENGEFIVIFYNSKQTKEIGKKSKRKDLENLILDFCSTPKNRQEIVDYIGLSYFYVVNNLLKGLIEKGKIGLTIPNKPRSAKQKYYVISL